MVYEGTIVGDLNVSSTTRRWWRNTPKHASSIHLQANIRRLKGIKNPCRFYFSMNVGGTSACVPAEHMEMVSLRASSWWKRLIQPPARHCSGNECRLCPRSNECVVSYWSTPSISTAYYRTEVNKTRGGFNSKEFSSCEWMPSTRAFESAVFAWMLTSIW